MARKSDINFPLIVTIAIASVLLLAVVVVGLEAWFHWEEQRESAFKNADAPWRPLVESREEQRKHLREGIGIEEAMKRVAQTRGAQKRGAATQTGERTVQP